MLGSSARPSPASSPDHQVAGNTLVTAPSNHTFFPALDGLRAVAFLMVFFQHYLFLPWGWAGVNIFFVLSGFLITGILLDTRDSPNRARNFYIRRSLRIFPLYYGCIAVLLLLQPRMHWEWDRHWIPWTLYLGNYLRFVSQNFLVSRSPLQLAADAHLVSSHLSFKQLNFGHFWSLCVEEQFYLLWPWVVFLVPGRKTLLWICSAAVLLIPVLRIYVGAHAPQWVLDAELLYRATPFQLDSLLLGGLTAVVWRGSYRRQMLLAARWLTGTLLAILVVYTLINSVQTWKLEGFSSGEFPFQYHLWRLTWGLSYVNLLAAGIMLCALVPGSLTYRLLHAAPLRHLGRISYGLYIFHDIWHVWWFNLAKTYCGRVLRPEQVPLFQPAVAAAIALPVTWLLAWVSYRFYEGPLLSLKDRWAARP